jgi:hypothetical protein
VFRTCLARCGRLPHLGHVASARATAPTAQSLCADGLRGADGPGGEHPCIPWCPLANRRACRVGGRSGVGDSILADHILVTTAGEPGVRQLTICQRRRIEVRLAPDVGCMFIDHDN